MALGVNRVNTVFSSLKCCILGVLSHARGNEDLKAIFSKKSKGRVSRGYPCTSFQNPGNISSLASEVDNILVKGVNFASSFFRRLRLGYHQMKEEYDPWLFES